ncbi:MAG: methionyl-tRNA formyltransferase, partial [Actinomycetota bacterium]|nr:methionyl-tRNA formyltransferase [Actinomycetota bacterium]
VHIDDSDDARLLGNKLAQVGAETLITTLERLVAGRLTATPQPQEGASYARLLTKDDGAVDWTRPAKDLHRQVRGLTPWPGTYCGFRGKKMKIHAAELGAGAGVPGHVLAVEDGAIEVACGEDSLRLLRVQPPGKKAQGAADFVRGYRPEVGESLALSTKDTP